MIGKREIPPTAGLPMIWQDWLPIKGDFARVMADIAALPPLLLECSGTVAFMIGLQTLKALDESRSEVVVPAYNCPLVIKAILACGLIPVVCDTAPDSFDFDFVELERLVSTRTLAIVPTHLGGQIADVGPCVELAHNVGCFVVEDAAQAFGARLGTLSDIVFFSLAVGKGLTLYEGGFVTSHSKKMRDALALTHQKIVKRKFWFELMRVLSLAGYSLVYRPNFLGLAYGWPRRRQLKRGNLISAVGDYFNDAIPIHDVSRMRARRGLRAAKRLPQFWLTTRFQAENRIRQLQAVDSRIKLVSSGDIASCVWPFFMILLPSELARDRALAKLWHEPFGVTRLFIHPLTDYEYLKHQVGPQKTPINARNFASRLLTISNSPWLSDDSFAIICGLLKEALGDASDKN